MTRTRELIDTANAHMVGIYNPFPFIVARGEGTLLWDLDGREYLDFTTGIAVNALGHAHPRVARAIAEQAGRFAHVSNLFFSEPHIAMCARLAKLAKLGGRVFLANSGTEAIEAALKLARRHFFDQGESRPELVATVGSFHGRTMGALAITGQESYRKGFEPMLPSATLVPYGDLDAMRRVIGRKTAAVFVEPVQGNSGVVVPPPGYLTGLRQLCTAAGALLVIDEIQSGFGRTGRWFAWEHEGVTPDIMTCAKAVGGGLPLGAMVTTEALAQSFTVGVHGTTFGGNPVSCAAGLATLDVIEEEHLVERAAGAGERFIGALRALAATRPLIQDVRGRGFMVGVVLTEAAKPVQAALRERGLLVTVSGQNVLRLLPPLNVEDRELERALEIMGEVLRR